LEQLTVTYGEGLLDSTFFNVPPHNVANSTAVWMVNNLERRFDGNIHSLGLMAHVIDEALKDKGRRDRIQQKHKVQQHRLQKENDAEVLRGKAEQEITELRDAEQQRRQKSAPRDLPYCIIRCNAHSETLLLYVATVATLFPSD
jgi:predicted ribosome quality control (RQC) complex YloA/Tae2 family protein